MMEILKRKVKRKLDCQLVLAKLETASKAKQGLDLTPEEVQVLHQKLSELLKDSRRLNRMLAIIHESSDDESSDKYIAERETRVTEDKKRTVTRKSSKAKDER